MSKSFYVTDMHSGITKEMQVDAKDIPGWNDLVKGWSVGGRSAVAPLQLDEELVGLDLGSFPASNHMILWGKVKPGAESGRRIVHVLAMGRKVRNTVRIKGQEIKP